jgi:hypothetical protein
MKQILPALLRRAKTPIIGVLTPVVISGWGCSNTGDTSESPPPADGGIEAQVNPDIQAVCPGACETVRACEPTVDIAACETQCAKELSGDGYLIPYVALPVFKEIRDTSDYPCPMVYNTHAFQKVAGEIPTDLALMDRCRNEMVRFSSEEPVAYTELCFYGFYRYNTWLRDEILPCFSPSVEGKDLKGCMLDKGPTDNLWIAGAPYPPAWPL